MTTPSEDNLNTSALPPQPASVLAAVPVYLGLGLPVVPVALGSTEPSSSAEQVRLAGDHLEALFTPGTIVGVQLDATALVEVVLADDRDIDLLAKRLLPATFACRGHDGRLRMLFRASGAVAVALRDPDGEVLVELRTTGVALLPPSEDKASKRVLYIRGETVAAISFDELHFALAQIAAIAVVGGSWPGDDEAQKRAALALAGGLCNVGFSPEEAEKFAALVAEIGEDPDGDRCIRAVSSTWDRHHRGDKNLGWHELGNQIGVRAARFARKILADAIGDASATIATTTAAIPAATDIAGTTTTNTTSDNTPPPAPPPAAFNNTDVANARRLVEQHGVEMRHAAGLGWFVWDGRRWIHDETSQVHRWAQDIARSIATAARQTGDLELLKHARRSESKYRLTAMPEVAAVDPRVVCTADQLDADPWLLNVANGTIDLRTGLLLPHDPKLLITKLAPVAYDPSAPCPAFESFLRRIFDGDQALIDFLQRAAGYSMTGVISEHVLFLLHGAGANGKSTLLNVLQHVLGDYAATTEPELLLTRRGEVHPTGLTDLFGRRLAVSHEVALGRSFNEALLKQLTGGDRIRARRMRQDFFEFGPTHKLWLGVNALPAIIEGGEAMRRRVRVIPFRTIIPVAERDPKLTEKLIAEATGVLVWAVRGCLAWQAHGLNPPPAVLDAVEEYLEDADPLADFITEKCATGREQVTTAKVLHLAYREWCDQGGEQPLSRRDFAACLRARGFEPHKGGKGTRLWRGIALSFTQVVPTATKPMA